VDPEYELAIKITEYLELLWDGQLPVWLLDSGGVSVTFAALLPRDLNAREPESEASLVGVSDDQADFRSQVMCGAEAEVAAKLSEFLSIEGFRKPRLRRAAKSAGLWMRARTDLGEGQYPDRYVPPVGEENYRFLSPTREFKPRDPFSEKEVLDDIAKQSSNLIAADLIAAAKFFAHHPMARLFSDCQSGPEERERDVKRPTISHERANGVPRPSADLHELPARLLCKHSPSVASLQYDLTSHFFRFPAHLSQIAEVLRYVPSFTARVADMLIAAAPRRSAGVLRKAIDSGAYSVATAFLRNTDRKLTGVRVGAAVRQMKNVSPADLVEAAIREIAPADANLYQRSPRIEHLNSTEKNAVFVISMYLLEAKRWCVQIADAFEIPVPFGVVLIEELEHIDICRSKRPNYA
jgi:hypothetical protein